MDSKISKKKIFSSISRLDPLIEANFKEDIGSKVFNPISFHRSDVGCIHGMGDKTSCIILKLGIKIFVALPFKSLQEKIYKSNSPEVDLTFVTGNIDQLKEIFNKTAGLQIEAIVRKPYSSDRESFIFSEDFILRSEEGIPAKSVSKKTTTITLDPEKTVLPFGERYVNIDMPREDFLRELKAAKDSGQGKLDLVKIFAKNPGRYGFKPD